MAAQRAHGAEVAPVEGEDRVGVVVRGQRHVHRVGEVQVQGGAAGPDGLGGAQGIDTITAEAGVAKMSLYNNFSSRPTW